MSSSPTPKPVRVKLTAAQRRVLKTHDSARIDRHGLAWTIDLCQHRTWESLYDLGLLSGGRITPAGRQLLKDSSNGK